MAGSNLSQVFIANADLVGDSVNPATLAAGNVGMYDVNAGAFVDDAAWTTLKSINFMQGITGSNPIASPILDTRMIRRVDYTKYAATVPHKIVLGGTPVSGQTVTVRIVVRTTPTDYLNYYPNGVDTTLDGSGFQFPLAAFNTTNHKVFPIEILTSSTTLATETNKIQAAIQANPVLNALINTGTTNNFIARHPGVVFEMAISNTAGTSTGLTQTVTGYVPGVGNAWQVIADVRRTDLKKGSMNRMYFADNFATNVNPTWKYDKILIEYAHDWPTSTGIAPAGELNQLVIYLGDSSTALASGDFAAFETVFAVALATNEDQIYQAL